MKVEEIKKLPVKERFLYFVREREKVRLAKEAGQPKPWTDDERLLNYSFCNVRRMDDRVSRWLMDNWYGPFKNHPNIHTACLLARTFNVTAALDTLTIPLFVPQMVRGLPLWKWVKKNLENHWQTGTIFNAAYIIRGSKGESKLDTVLRRVKAASVHWYSTINTNFMERSHAALMKYEGFGSFLAGQVVADLRWAKTGVWGDRHVWAPMGPGSKRGIERFLWGETGRPTSVPKYDWQVEFLTYMGFCRQNLPTSITERLEAIDFQNCLCEADKMDRLLFGEGRVKRKYPGAK